MKIKTPIPSNLETKGKTETFRLTNLVSRRQKPKPID